MEPRGEADFNKARLLELVEAMGLKDMLEGLAEICDESALELSENGHQGDSEAWMENAAILRNAKSDVVFGR